MDLDIALNQNSVRKEYKIKIPDTIQTNFLSHIFNIFKIGSIMRGSKLFFATIVSFQFKCYVV